MAKSIDEILGAAGLERSSTAPSAAVPSTGRPLADLATDSYSDSRPRQSDTMTAPSIGSGKVKGRQRLVEAASDAFRRATANVEASMPPTKTAGKGRRGGRAARLDGSSPTPDPVGASNAGDVELVRVKSKRHPCDRSDSTPPDKTVVVSKRQGRIIGRQG